MGLLVSLDKESMGEGLLRQIWQRKKLAMFMVSITNALLSSGKHEPEIRGDNYMYGLV